MAITTGALYNCETIDKVPWFSFTKQNYSEVKCDNDAINSIPFYQIFGVEANLFWLFKIPMYYWFRVTYYTTLVSCTFGILRFLDIGTTRILAASGWQNIFGFALAFVSVFHSLHTKALGLGTGGGLMKSILLSSGYCSDSGSHIQTTLGILYIIYIYLYYIIYSI